MQDDDRLNTGGGASPPVGATNNPLIAKLESLAKLSEDDRAVLQRISANPQVVEPGTSLQRHGLIALAGQQTTIADLADLAGLEAFAEFEPNYLHLGARDAA